MAELEIRDISVKAGGKALVRQAGLRVGAGELVVLIGPNGAGKTSLLRAALGLIAPESGSAVLDDVPVSDLSPMARARKISYLPQRRELAWPARVRDVVALGRFAYGGTLGRLTRQDQAAVDRALDDCDLMHLSERRADSLSGGEQTRMHLARAFAARAPLLLADEPIAALDPRHQVAVLKLVRGFVARGGGALLILHDLQLAARFATRLVWMHEGRIVANGSVAETLTPDRLHDVFGVTARVEDRQIIMSDLD